MGVGATMLAEFASLVGRSLGFKRVVTRIEDPSYEHLCIELGLTDLIVPDYTIARYLADLCAGSNPLELSAVIKGDARLFDIALVLPPSNSFADGDAFAQSKGVVSQTHTRLRPACLAA